MSNCNICCNLNDLNKSELNINKKMCSKIIYSNNYTFWLEQNKNFNKYLHLNKKYSGTKKNIKTDKYFGSFDEYLHYIRGLEIQKNPNTPFIGNPI